MAIVNVSLDTSTRQAVLTVNGVLVPAEDICVEKYVYDGQEFIRFNYVIESVNPDGMKERRQFYLPSPEELAVQAHAKLDNDGFASKLVYNPEKAKEDTIEFLKKSTDKV